MAYNDISKNYTYENGGTIDGDLALTTIAANTKIKNKASGQLYAKRSGFTNVFDKTNTYADYLKATDLTINSSGSGNGVASITYSSSGRKITQNLTTFTTPSDLATANDNLKSQAVGSISVSGRTVTYKNVNGQSLGSFQTQDTDTNTTYSANKGITLSGTTFGHSLEHVDDVYNLESIGSFRLSGNTLIASAGKITFDKYGHMRNLDNIERSVDLSNITANIGIGSDPFAVGSTIIIGAGYEENLNYGNIFPGGAKPGWCPDDGGGALSEHVYIPGTWICVCGSGNNSNVRGAIIRRIA